MKKFRFFSEFQEELERNKGLQDAFKADPVQASQQLTSEIPDTSVYRIVVVALGLAILFVIIGAVILAGLRVDIDPTLITLFAAIASGAVGALSGLLAPSPKQN